MFMEGFVGQTLLHVPIERILLEVTSGVRVDRAAAMCTHFDMVTRVNTFG